MGCVEVGASSYCLYDELPLYKLYILMVFSNAMGNIVVDRAHFAWTKLMAVSA